MPIAEATQRLRGKLDGILRENESLARHTSFRIGGPAALWIECDSLRDLSLVSTVLTEEEVPWRVLGKGTNVLAADAGYDGAVVILGRDFKRHSVTDLRIHCGAGVGLSAIVQDAFSKGLSGLEFAVGIPGTVGGAIAMNAGSRERWIGEIVDQVTLFRVGEGLVSLGGSEIAWGYRQTDLAGRGVVVEVTLALQAGDEWHIRNTMEAALRRRKRSQPLGMPNAGSVFVNPPNESAGRLIEEAGLKGHRVGGAMISDVHANFIVNVGGATSADVLALVKLMSDTVKEVHGIELRPEVRFLGAHDAA